MKWMPCCLLAIAFMFLACQSQQQVSWIELQMQPGLEQWQGESGEWFVAADVKMNPEDEKFFISEPGTGIVVNGEKGHTKHLISKAEYGSCELHVEFMVPRGSNSGVYVMSRYEVQVLDSYGVEKPKYSDCGGIYQRYNEDTNEGYEGHSPRVNASLPPGEWQIFDIVFCAPEFDAQNNKIKNAKFIKVVHNGQIVHENVEVTGPTRSAAFEDEKPLGPLMFQGDHGPVAYRNIKIKPVECE